MTFPIALQAARLLCRLLKVVPGGIRGRHDVRGVSVRRVVLAARVIRRAEVEHRVPQQELVFHRHEIAVGFRMRGRRNGRIWSQASPGIIRLVEQKAALQGVPRRKAHLHPEQIVAAPLDFRVLPCGQLGHQMKGSLSGHCFGEPRLAFLEGAGKSDSRVPVSKIYSALEDSARAQNSSRQNASDRRPLPCRWPGRPLRRAHIRRHSRPFAPRRPAPHPRSCAR